MSHLRLPSTPDELTEAGWITGDTERRLAERRHGWHRSDGACAACVQDALLSLLREKGERVLGRVIQDVWPLDAEAAFGALPTPPRMRADLRSTQPRSGERWARRVEQHDRRRLGAKTSE